MDIVAYWTSKTKLLEKAKEAFKGWNLSDQIIVRKMIVSKMMDITIDNISYYLKRDEWLKEFTLGNDDEVLLNVSFKEHYVKKVDSILKEFFYLEDYRVLYKLVENHIKTGEEYDKNNVCMLVKELLIPSVFEKLSDNNKNKVFLYEKIYFEPIELINEYLMERAGADVYYTILMEQWKTANEMAANISAQRNNMNNFYVSLMSILVGGILFSDQLLSTNNIAKTVLFFTIAITGVFVCKKWRLQIDNYGKLNGAKYEVINELERNLPANVMYCEWLRTERNARKQKRKINFSEQEVGIAKLFEYVVLIVPIIMLVGTWWDEICRLIQMVVQNLK